MEPSPESPGERELEDVVQHIVVDSSRIDAITARVAALELEVPLGQVELQEELERLEAKLEAVLTRLAKLETTEAPPPRGRGVIGAHRVGRPIVDGDSST